MSIRIQQIGPAELGIMRSLLGVFGDAFDERDTYSANPPSDDYLRGLLAGESFVALAAIDGGKVVGGLAAYELRKFEQARSEIYIYDLAVAAAHRRRGVATALIGELRRIAADRNAWVIYVQADTAPEDEPARRLYDKLGRREEVLHFDIDP